MSTLKDTTVTTLTLPWTSDHAPAACYLLPGAWWWPSCYLPCLLPGSAAGLLLAFWPVVVVLACLPAGLLAWLPASARSNQSAGNPNLDNGIPGIQIQAYRKRSAFGFGIPPYDLLIPREIHIEHGYARTSQSHHHVCHRLIATSANVCQHQITASGHQGVVRKTNKYDRVATK